MHSAKALLFRLQTIRWQSYLNTSSTAREMQTLKIVSAFQACICAFSEIRKIYFNHTASLQKWSLAGKPAFLELLGSIPPIRVIASHASFSSPSTQGGLASNISGQQNGCSLPHPPPCVVRWWYHCQCVEGLTVSRFFLTCLVLFMTSATWSELHPRAAPATLRSQFQPLRRENVRNFFNDCCSFPQGIGCVLQPYIMRFISMHGVVCLY